MRLGKQLRLGGHGHLPFATSGLGAAIATSATLLFNDERAVLETVHNGPGPPGTLLLVFRLLDRGRGIRVVLVLLVQFFLVVRQSLAH